MSRVAVRDSIAATRLILSGTRIHGLQPWLLSAAAPRLKTADHISSRQFLILLKSNPVFLHKLPDHRMIIRIELRHGSNEDQLTFVEKGDVVGHLLCAISDIVCNDHLRKTE